MKTVTADVSTHPQPVAPMVAQPAGEETVLEEPQIMASEVAADMTFLVCINDII